MRQVLPNSPISLAFDFVYAGVTVSDVEDPVVEVYSFAQALMTAAALTWSGAHYEARVQAPQELGVYVAVAHGKYNGDYITAASHEALEVVSYGVEARHALITLNEVKEYLELTDFSEDAFLRLLTEACINSVLNYLHITIGPQTTKDVFPVSDCASWSLNYYPVISVEHISVDGVELSSTNYTLNVNTGTIWFNELISGVLEVEYTYGLTSIPYDMKLACLKLAAVLYNLRNTEGYSSRRLLSVAETYLTSSKADVFHEIRSLLAPYKRVSR